MLICRQTDDLTGVEEIWENGQAFADLAARIDAITEQREAIETGAQGA